jgi:hypothetical protein
MLELELLVQLLDSLGFGEGYAFADADDLYFDLDLLELIILVCDGYFMVFLLVEVDDGFVGLIFSFKVVNKYKLDNNSMLLARLIPTKWY